MQRSWRRQFLPTAVTHLPAHVPWTIYNSVENPVCEGWASYPKLHLLLLRIVKSALHRQLENWFFFSGSTSPSGAVRKPLEQVKKGLGSSQVSCLQLWSDPEVGIILCTGVTKMPMAKGHSGSLAKGTTLHNGSKWIFALAPWAILFLRPGSTLLAPCDSWYLGFYPTWVLSSSCRAQSCLPLPHPHSSLTHSHDPLQHRHTHTMSTLHTEWNQTAETSVFHGHFHSQSKGQILTPALLLTQLSSPALKLYLSKAVPSFLQTGKLFQRIEIVLMFWPWNF